MKTIQVVFVDDVNKSRISDPYSFLCEGEVSKGDILRMQNYDNDIRVINVIDGEYPYYNPDKKQLLKEQKEGSIPLKTIKIADSKDKIIATKLINLGN